MELEVMSTELLPEETGTVTAVEPWYKKSISLEDAKAFIKTNIVTAARSFIAIGFYLKCVRDQELYREDGFENIWDFARDEYGISKSTASRYMSMNDKFSVEGNSPVIQEEYRLFDKSKLQEMLYLEDEQLKEITPESTVKDIRGMRPPKEIPYIHIPGQVNITDFPECMPDSYPVIQPPFTQETVQSQPFTLSIADMLPGPAGATSQLTEVLPLPLVALPEAETEEIPLFTLENKMSIEGAYGAYRHEMVNCYFAVLSELLGVLENEPEQRMLDLPFTTFGDVYYTEYDDGFVMFREQGKENPIMVVSIERLNDDFEWWQNRQVILNSDCNDIQLEQSNDVSLPAELNGEVYTPQYFLEEQKSKLNNLLQITNGKTPSNTGIEANERQIIMSLALASLVSELDLILTVESKTLSRADIEDIERQKFVALALASMVDDLENIEPESVPQNQPELPILKNNDQRAAFIDAYETWPLWIETEETGERYYRYELPDDTAIVIRVYYARLFDYQAHGKPYEERFTDGWGKHEYYLVKQEKHFRDCDVNKSFLIDHLKKIQKKEKGAES